MLKPIVCADIMDYMYSRWPCQFLRVIVDGHDC